MRTDRPFTGLGLPSRQGGTRAPVHQLTRRRKAHLLLSARSSRDVVRGEESDGRLLQRGGQLRRRLVAALRDIPARGRGLLMLNLLVRFLRDQ